MTQYLMSVHHDYGKPIFASDAEFAEAMAATGVFNEKLIAAGEFVFAGGLEEPATATVVDATHGDTMMTDGPFLEAREHIGGFWVVELPDLNTALVRAAEGSAACRAAVEVRPFQGM